MTYIVDAVTHIYKAYRFEDIKIDTMIFNNYENHLLYSFTCLSSPTRGLDVKESGALSYNEFTSYLDDEVFKAYLVSNGITFTRLGYSAERKLFFNFKLYNANTKYWYDIPIEPIIADLLRD